MTLNFRSLVHAKGKVSAELAAAAVWGVIGERRYADQLAKEDREKKFQAAGFTSEIRLNLAAALLAKKDGKRDYAAALSILNRTTGLETKLAAEANAYHQQFFGLKNLKEADQIYRAKGGVGHFLKQMRKLAEHGDDNRRKVLIVAVLAHSFAKLLGLDPMTFGVDYFRDRLQPGLLGYEQDGSVHMNLASIQWRRAFAKAIGTTAHETLHALHAQNATAFAEGRIAPDHPRYLHYKATFINMMSYEPADGSPEGERRYQESYLETAANLVADRFEGTALRARVSNEAVLTKEVIPHARRLSRHRRPPEVPTR